MARSVFFFVVALVGCQRYDFEPVEPVTIITSESVFELAPVLKPNVMLTVDRSGSMNALIDARCQGPACATRMSELKSAVATFTTLADDRVRLGLTAFPRPPITETGAAASCLPANSVAVGLPASSLVDDAQASAANRTNAAQVNSAVQALVPGGGTPTGATLSFLGTQPSLASADFRNDFVLLLTDGLPNCNANNPNDFLVSANACRCQTGGGDCSATEVRRLGCLDADGTVEQVSTLARAGVKTIVVGFGADTSQGDARDVLERLAQAGGVPRACQQSSECGAGDTCSNGRCGRWSFQASNRAELEQVLTTVLSGITPAACVRELPDRPIAPGAVSLLVDGQPIARGPDTWRLISNDRQLELAPAFCEAHHGSTLKLRVAGSP
ncbi:MAG: adventurous gliding motility lipoprotein CglB [Myxococcaceae bacterium]|nr:adventurous gliding motility lipoprotein CglB [Myxococcaceae bacterium]